MATQNTKPVSQAVENKTEAIAALERKIAEAKSEIAKKALKEKLERLKQEAQDSDVEANKLAVVLLKQRKKIKELAQKDFDALIRRLANKPQYSFLKNYTRDEIVRDMSRKAKPVGWRFKGKNNYKIPSKKQVTEGVKKGNVYYENRPKQSDVSFPAQLGKGGGINMNNNCIVAIVQMVDKINEVRDYYIYDNKLIIILQDELMVYAVEMANANLSKIKGCSEVVDGEFEIGYDENYQTLILPLKTDNVSVGKFNKGGGVDLTKNDIEILGVPRSRITEKEWQSILRMAKYQNGATFILKDDRGIDVKPQVEYEWYIKEKYANGGGVGYDYYPQYDINEEGNFAATIGGKNYEIIYRDDVSQMYDLFQDGNMIASDTYIRNLMSFDKYDTDDMPVIRTQFEEDYFEYGDGGNIPYVVWTSKDGNTRQLYKTYKSMKAAKIAAKKLITSGDYEEVGTKPKTSYEKNGFYADGGEIDTDDKVWKVYSLGSRWQIGKSDGTMFGSFSSKDEAEMEAFQKNMHISNIYPYFAKGGKVKPKMVRSQFEEEEFEYGGGGSIDDVFNEQDFDSLKKGDEITITYESGISRSNNVELKVQSKTTVGKGKSYQSEKITFINKANPTGVRYYAYKRVNGNIGFAIGDMAIWGVKQQNNYGKGGVIKYYDESNAYRLGSPASMPKNLQAKISYDLLRPYFAGNFGWKYDKKMHDGYLFNLDDYDKEFIANQNIKLKQGEKIYRYTNERAAIGGYVFFIKINCDKELIYFMRIADFGDESIEFDTKGIKPTFLNLIKNEGGKSYGDGGEVDFDNIDMPIIRTQFEEEYFEYAKGGNAGEPHRKEQMGKGGGVSTKFNYIIVLIKNEGEENEETFTVAQFVAQGDAFIAARALSDSHYKSNIKYRVLYK
jgi:hypothetical protein